MSANQVDVWKLGTFARLRKAWKYGGRAQRLIASAIVAEPIGAFLILLPTLFSSLPPGEVVVILLNGLMALVAQAVFLPAQYVVALPPGFWRAAIAEGWMPKFEREYYAELARYCDAFGAHGGLLPGDLGWAVASALLYLGTVVIAVLTTLVLYPVLHLASVAVFAAFEVPVALVFFAIYAKHSGKQMKLAGERGYRLRELKRDVDQVLRQRAMAARK